MGQRGSVAPRGQRPGAGVSVAPAWKTPVLRQAHKLEEGEVGCHIERTPLEEDVFILEQEEVSLGVMTVF